MADTGDRSPIPVVLVGAGHRAAEWAGLLGRSTTARLAAIVTRAGGAPSLDVPAPRFHSLDAALDAVPGARVAVALPPRAGLDAALDLAARRQPGVVEAPLHGTLATVALPPGAAGVQVAHGWVTLRTTRWLVGALHDRRCERVTIDVRGLPEEPGGDPGEVLPHALALALRLFPGLRLRSGVMPTDALTELELDAPTGAAVRLRAHTTGRGLEVRAEGEGFVLGATVKDSAHLCWVHPARAPRSERPFPPTPGAVRALHQLVAPAEALGDDLVAAQRVATLAAEVHAATGRAPTVSARGFRAATALAAAGRPIGDQLGLRGALPPAPPAPELRVPTWAEPLELWPFRAGRKPVAFLTVPPHDVDRVLAHFPGAHVERHERRVHVGPQDAWTDRRDLGDARVELYVSRDPALAREAARLQTEGDPTRSLEPLGRLMGYPACCVRAFASQTDRSNNTQNRYLTFARTTPTASYPWQLNNLCTMLIPCFPCTYTCSAALDLADAAIGELDRAHPGSRAALASALARPMLYLDHDRLVALDGATLSSVAGGPIGLRGTAVPREAPAELAHLAGVIGLGDALRFDDAALTVMRGAAVVARLARTDPGLGFLAPFAPSAPTGDR